MPEHNHSGYERPEIESSPEQSPQAPQPSSSNLTRILLGAAIVVGLAILHQETRLPASDPYAKCQMIIGMDRACETRVAIGEINRGRP